MGGVMKTAIVLQGGGAAGSWQAGVLEALLTSDSFKKSVISVIGTSIGGLNGALLVQQLNYASSTNRPAVPVTFANVWGTRVGWHMLLRSRLASLIADVCSPPLLQSGPVYLVTTATVVKSRLRAISVLEEYDMLGPKDRGLHIFQFGPTHSWTPSKAVTALLATSALPWLYGPVRYDKFWLSDGGLLANLPADIVKDLKPQAFVVISPRAPTDEISHMPALAQIDLAMRRRLCILKQFVSRSRLGAIPVYHIHPGHCSYLPPNIVNFSPIAAKRSFRSGYALGWNLKAWTHACLAPYQV
jgi:hypothetical protein